MQGSLFLYDCYVFDSKKLLFCEGYRLNSLKP